MSSRPVPDGINPDLFSICSGTNSTASNLDGAGRLVGNLLSHGGRRVEGLVGSIAHRLGFGPTAAVLRLLAPSSKITCPRYCDTAWRRKCFRKFRGEANCEHLLRYLREYRCSICRASFCETVVALSQRTGEGEKLFAFASGPSDIQTQVLALNYIGVLAAFHPSLRKHFKIFSASIYSVVGEYTFVTSHEVVALSHAYHRAKESLDHETAHQIFEHTWGILYAARRTGEEKAVPESAELRALLRPENDTAYTLPFPVIVQLFLACIYHWEIAACLHIALFPSRTAIKHLVQRCCTARDPFASEIYRRALKFLQTWRFFAKGSPQDERRAAADFWVPVLRQRMECEFVLPYKSIWPYRRLPRIPKAVEASLEAEGRPLIMGTTPGIKALQAPDTLEQLMEAVLFGHPGQLSPKLIPWLEGVIRAFDGS